MDNMCIYRCYLKVCLYRPWPYILEVCVYRQYTEGWPYIYIAIRYGYVLPMIIFAHLFYHSMEDLS